VCNFPLGREVVEKQDGTEGTKQSGHVGEWRYSPPFLSSALDGVQWSAVFPGPFTLGKGCCMNSICSLDTVQ
jgi:hypothetical protein